MKSLIQVFDPQFIMEQLVKDGLEVRIIKEKKSIEVIINTEEQRLYLLDLLADMGFEPEDIQENNPELLEEIK